MYNVSVSPHVREQSTTQSIMRDVIIALLPILAFGVYHFGFGALQVIIISVVTCVVGELLFDLAVKKPVTVFDGSAVVTGLILAINLPATAIWWMPVLGGLFAIVAVKMLFGGLGQNFMNPALAARCFLLISFSGRMTDFTLDGVSAATPLASIKAGEIPDLLSLFLGFHGGCIGEVSALAILAGGAYLIIKKIISIRIPLTYVLSTVVFILLINLINGGDTSAAYLAAQVLSGGLLVGAFFMATDYATSPITVKGQLLYGMLLGLFTALFRTVGSSAEGVSYAIIICNLLVPLIEKVTIPRPFGSEKAKGGSKA
ncbi:RnfABCDGE type electron transport complex subunit D [Ihubacter sp. rT4E-8]|uniref:RnfABCDGE type electron transport complex subunit D n=1 Tax=Ihubacter sp. rT4E-8 TaxID=3242369 RepID=UPI003CEC79B5